MTAVTTHMPGIAKYLRGVTALAWLAAIGCASTTTVGVSGEPEPQTSPEPAGATSPPSKPRTTTAIVAAPGEELSFTRPALGDVDGDGYEDFMLVAAHRAGAGANQYLFYGRPEFPAELVSSDADAVFESYWGYVGGLGDINGDGLADFTLLQEDGYELVFGDRTRKTGRYEPYSGGVAWGAVVMTDPQRDKRYYLAELRPAADFDGDGADEFLVQATFPLTMEEYVMRGGVPPTDFVMAGKRDGWPAAPWDPSWAVAHFGDEPPTIEDDEATTVIERLRVAGSADLDGDHYADVLAQGRWSAWIFYGSPAGFHGTLTPDQAAAELVWEHSPERSLFGESVPFIVGDVDGDGTNDLAFRRGKELDIVYGKKTRLQGRVKVEPDLTIEAPGKTVTATARDVDGDAVAELLILADETPTSGAGAMLTKAGMYAVRTRSLDTRTSSRYRLRSSDLYRPAGNRTPAAASLSFQQQFVGDLDGDGSCELLVGAFDEQASFESSGVVYLIPGGTPIPQ